MKALYSREKDSLERLYDADAMKRSALKRGNNFVRRDWTDCPDFAATVTAFSCPFMYAG